MADPKMRLVVYDGNTPISILPSPLSVEWGVPINDTPALQFKYSANDEVIGSGYIDSLIENQYDIAVEMDWSGEGEWVEERCGRFLIMDDGDDSTDQNEVHSFVGVGVIDDTAGVIITSSSGLDTEGKRNFSNATPGQILDTYHNFGADNGMLKYLTNDFSPSQTSDPRGRPWETTSSIGFPREASYRTVIDTLVSYGLINWCTEGNVLRVFDNGATGEVSDDQGMQRDLTDGDTPVELVIGRECVDGPNQRTRRNLATDALVLGDNNNAWVRSSDTNHIKRGRRVVAASIGGITTAGSANVVGDQLLRISAQNVEQYTRTLDLTNARFLPWKSYKPGDWVFGPNKKGNLERLRVYQITITQDENGRIGGSVILNDRLTERSIALQRKVDALSAGVAIGGTGGASKPSPPGRKPKKPSGRPSITAAAYVDKKGKIHAVIQVAWAQVTAGEDEGAIDIDKYEVRIRKTGN